MTDRKKLAEVMARALKPAVWDYEPTTGTLRKVQTLQRAMLVADANDAIDAAERAGFRWVAPEDGR